MTALTDFMVAAASYMGLPDGQVLEGSTVDASSGDLELVLRVSVTADDLVGIGKRMGVLMAQKAVDDAQRVKAWVDAPELTNEELRAAWQALEPSEQSRHGSFGRYKLHIEHGTMPLGDLELPAHVWMHGNALTEQQKAMAVGMDEKGRYAMDPDDLTGSQRLRLDFPLEGPA